MHDQIQPNPAPVLHLDDAPPGISRRRSRWGWLLLCMILMFAVLGVGGTLYFFWLSRNLPEGVNVNAIETAYPELIARVVKQAASGGGVSAPEVSQDDRLVAPSEILQARVGRNNGYTLVGKKHFDGSTVFVFPRQPTVGRPVLNKYWGTMRDGRKITIVTYEAKVLDPTGREWEILIDFDLEALAKRLKGGP